MVFANFEIFHKSVSHSPLIVRWLCSNVRGCVTQADV